MSSRSISTRCRFRKSMRVAKTEPHRFPDFETARHGRFSQLRASTAGKVLATLRPDPLARAKLEHWRAQLKHHPRLERASNVTLREATTISALISDLDRVGWLLAPPAVAMVFVYPTMGFVTDRFGCRAVVATGVVFTVAGWPGDSEATQN